MKALIVDYDSGGCMSALLGADSAFLRPGEPVFVPDPVLNWRSYIMPAVRISRLGMHISRSNVFRHLDSFTAFHVLLPAEDIAGIPCGLIDRTFSPGQWLAADDACPDSVHSLSATVSAIGGTKAEISENVAFSFESLRVAETVESLSRFCTFRTGDVLLFAGAALNLGAPALNTVVGASLDLETVLNIRIK